MKPIQWYIFLRWCYRLDVDSKGLARKLHMLPSIISSIACRLPASPKGSRNHSHYENMKKLVEGICLLYYEEEIVFCSCEEIDKILRSGTLSKEEIDHLMSCLPAALPLTWRPSAGEVVYLAEKSIRSLERFVENDVKSRLSLRLPVVSVDKNLFATLRKEVKFIQETLAQLRLYIHQRLPWQPSDLEAVSQAEESIGRLEECIETKVKSLFDPKSSSVDDELVRSALIYIKRVKEGFYQLQLLIFLNDITSH